MLLLFSVMHSPAQSEHAQVCACSDCAALTYTNTHQYTCQSPNSLQGYKYVTCLDFWSTLRKLMYSEVNCLVFFIPYLNTTMTKCLKWVKFFIFVVAQCMQIHLWRSREISSALCRQILKRGSYNGKWMKSFSALKVLTQSSGHFNGSPNGRRAVWRWAAVPVCCRRACGSLVPYLDRHPVNFMLYLRNLHITLFAVPDIIPSTDKTEWEISDSSSDLCNIFLK